MLGGLSHWASSGIFVVRAVAMEGGARRLLSMLLIATWSVYLVYLGACSYLFYANLDNPDNRDSGTTGTFRGESHDAVLETLR